MTSEEKVPYLFHTHLISGDLVLHHWYDHPANRLQQSQVLVLDIGSLFLSTISLSILGNQSAFVSKLKHLHEQLHQTGEPNHDLDR